MDQAAITLWFIGVPIALLVITLALELSGIGRPFPASTAARERLAQPAGKEGWGCYPFFGWLAAVIVASCAGQMAGHVAGLLIAGLPVTLWAHWYLAPRLARARLGKVTIGGRAYALPELLRMENASLEGLGRSASHDPRAARWVMEALLHRGAPFVQTWEAIALPILRADRRSADELVEGLLGFAATPRELAGACVSTHVSLGNSEEAAQLFGLAMGRIEVARLQPELRKAMLSAAVQMAESLPGREARQVMERVLAPLAAGGLDPEERRLIRDAGNLAGVNGWLSTSAALLATPGLFLEEPKEGASVCRGLCEQMVEKKELDLAVKLGEQAVAYDPEDAEVRQSVARAYLARARSHQRSSKQRLEHNRDQALNHLAAAGGAAAAVAAIAALQDEVMQLKFIKGGGGGRGGSIGE